MQKVVGKHNKVVVLYCYEHRILIDNFQITKVDDIATRIDIYLEESKDLHKELKEGFYPWLYSR